TFLRVSSYVVIDRGAAPVLKVMAEMQRAAPREREEFIRNPRPRITSAMENALRAAGRLDGLSPAGEEEAIEAAAGPVLIETREYSERVTGIRVYEKPMLDLLESSSTTWLPEYFAPAVRDAVDRMDSAALEQLEREIGEAVAAGRDAVQIAGEPVPASSETLSAIGLQREARARDEAAAGHEQEAREESNSDAGQAPIIIDTKDNFEEVHWRPERGPRTPRITRERTGVATALKQHQVESLDWQIDAWCAGLPGVLNADEQGLGKTLQTLAFLRGLKAHMANPDADARGPVLVVAPTSLLETWEGEAARHLDEPGLGHLIRLYGSGLGGHRRAGKRGIDTESGEDKLDFDLLREAIAEGRAHRFWMLTTYTTLTNYQHSLARIPFSVVVFDEIQALKNPASLRACAGRAIRADFRIGLTGTPIENSTTDLWAIMDQLCPGALGSLRDFRKLYGAPDQKNMAELHARVFLPHGNLPPLALRRTKSAVARELPEKIRCLHPRAMPPTQASAYEQARVKLAEGSRGSALKMLHHIRTVSVHPALASGQDDADDISSSGRLSAVFDILRKVHAKRERALVFIEHRQMQYRFIELARQEFGLARIDLINGNTPIAERQKIVDRFQRHLVEDGGFDVLVLGPKAAGTGLTLTAATHVIHLSRWWNPAVEEQCNDRVHRIGQDKTVTVHVPMAVHPGYREHSFDCLLHSLMMRKRKLASSALWPMGDTAEDAAVLQRMVCEPCSETSDNPVSAAMAGTFARDQKPLPPFEPDGSLIYA
ncbi:MAG TPA: DEAD/DEAH box helicase, partial [Acidobacteriaceae bacterium]|nr:DEAD/DEAH box helicase [Acidobacteriaceae bacterium]